MAFSSFLALDQIKILKNRLFDSFCNILHHVESDIYHDKRTTFCNSNSRVIFFDLQSKMPYNCVKAITQLHEAQFKSTFEAHTSRAAH